MRHVVSFSGGRTSALLCILLKQNFGDDVDFIYMDTGAEHPNTYDFIRKVNAHFNLNLTCIRTAYSDELGTGNSYLVVPIEGIGPDYEPWKGMLKKYGAPSAVSAYCTSRMKTEPHDKYCNEKYGRKNYLTWIGIRADEPKRLKGKDGIAYLADIWSGDKQDVLDFWKTQPFDLELPEHLGNCVFCIKKGLNKVALAAKDEPEMVVDFVRIVEHSEDVRTTGRKHNHVRMYRQSKTLSEIVSDYSEIDRDFIFNNLRSQKRFDSGSCSESCEAFAGDL